MRVALLGLLLAGCAPTQGYYLSADGNGDVWTSGCPKVQDCEDVALCQVEKARANGEDWQLYRVRWMKHAPWVHVLAGNGRVFADQHGRRAGLPERGELTHICRQLGKHGVSTRGTWLCLPQSESEYVFKKEVE